MRRRLGDVSGAAGHDESTDLVVRWNVGRPDQKHEWLVSSNKSIYYQVKTMLKHGFNPSELWKGTLAHTLGKEGMILYWKVISDSESCQLLDF